MVLELQGLTIICPTGRGDEFGVVREEVQFAGKVNHVNGVFFDEFQPSNSPLNFNGVDSNHHQLAQKQTQNNHHQQTNFPKQPVAWLGSQLGSPGNGGGITGIGD
ncbi:hypothetical protein V6N13_054010 [Hibiscus sabdariffa]|uniref:Uncharacterized protein n=1 Tax=Hibiscus sabdariffa TaxID=183260 RepID=A0ABR2T6E0_9ROSI